MGDATSNEQPPHKPSGDVTRLRLLLRVFSAALTGGGVVGLAVVRLVTPVSPAIDAAGRVTASVAGAVAIVMAAFSVLHTSPGLVRKQLTKLTFGACSFSVIGCALVTAWWIHRRPLWLLAGAGAAYYAAYTFTYLVAEETKRSARHISFLRALRACVRAALVFGTRRESSGRWFDEFFGGEDHRPAPAATYILLVLAVLLILTPVFATADRSVVPHGRQHSEQVGRPGTGTSGR